MQLNLRTSKDFIKILDETEKRISLSGIKDVLLRLELKGHAFRGSCCSKTTIKRLKTDHSLQLHIGTNIYIFGDAFCVLMGLKLNYLFILIIIIWGVSLFELSYLCLVNIT